MGRCRNTRRKRTLKKKREKEIREGGERGGRCGIQEVEVGEERKGLEIRREDRWPE